MLLKGRPRRSCAAFLQILLDHRVTSLAALRSTEPIFQQRHDSIKSYRTNTVPPPYYFLAWRIYSGVSALHGSHQNQEPACKKRPKSVVHRFPAVVVPSVPNFFFAWLLPSVSCPDAATPPTNQGGKVPQLPQAGRDVGDFHKDGAARHRLHEGPAEPPH